MRKITVNRTTGYSLEVLNKIIERCEDEDRAWNDVIDEALRNGLGMNTGGDQDA